MMHKILKILTSFVFSTIVGTNLFACHPSVRANFELLTTVPTHQGYRLQIDTHNNWYVASDSKLIIGYQHQILKTIELSDLILSLFVDWHSNNWYVGTVNGFVYTGNFNNPTVTKLLVGQGVEIYSVYCYEGRWYAGASNGDVYTGQVGVTPAHLINNFTDTSILSINHLNENIIFGFNNGELETYDPLLEQWHKFYHVNGEVYNIVNQNNTLAILDSADDGASKFYFYQNNTWTLINSLRKGVIFNIALDNNNFIYGGDDQGNIYQIDNNEIKVLKIIEKNSIIDVKTFGNWLYILTDDGKIYDLRLNS
ncbi:hypothetical protein [Spiroplasma sp. DGKH1]|uniref:hypothetical protein n=1 Tax=Spiroplasma sp. DGKH1 TaxID=3050074 RepID=UPI0034C61FA6